MSKYHVQIVKARRDKDGGLYPVRDLGAETRHIVVEADDITDAKAKARTEINTWNGDWWIDGYPMKRGWPIGSMRIG